MQKLAPGTDPLLALSLFGVTGLTAYFGTLDIGQVKAGETFVVSGAAGATGSVAGMNRKNQRCRVVGRAGGREKCDWLVREAGFDAAIDYKNENVGDALTRHCPKWNRRLFRQRGRRDSRPRVDAAGHWRANRAVRRDLALQRIRDAWTGTATLLQFDSAPRANGGLPGVPVRPALSRGDGRAREVVRRAGRIKNKIDLAHGLENAPKTLIRLFTGANFGKQLLKLADPQ
jgi:NADPH-dependent curcumin reductase